MKNFITALIGSLLTAIFIYFLGIQVVQFLYLKRFDITLDFSLLFFDGNRLWFWLLTLIIVMISLNIFMSSMCYKKINRKHSKDDKVNFSHLASKHEAKKGLLRLEYDNDRILENTPMQMMDRIMNPSKKIANSILTIFKVKDIHKFNTIKTWMINDQRVYKRGGFPIYTPRFLKNRMYVDPDDTHSIIIGSTNSGKTESVLMLLLSNLVMAQENLVVVDPKGELYAKIANKLDEKNYHTICLDFIHPEHSDWWNPFGIVWQQYTKAKDEFNIELTEWELKKASLYGDDLENHMLHKPELDISQALEYLEDLANILTFDKEAKDKFWNDAAGKTLIGMSLLLLKQNDPDILNAKNISMLLNQSDIRIPDSIKKQYKIMSRTLLGAYLEKFEPFDSDVKLKLSDYADGAEATAKSIKQVLSVALKSLTSNEQVMRITSNNNFKLEDLANKKMAIFIKVHDEKKTYHPLVTLFIKQLYEQLISEARDHKGRLKIPLNVLIEEAGNCPPFKDIDSMLSASRSRGIRFTFVLQAFSQFVEIYGEKLADTVFTNCMNTCYLLSSNKDTLDKMSDICGKHQVWLPARNMYESRPLISADRLQHLNLGEAVFHRQRKNAFITRMVPYSKSRFNDHTFSELPTKPKPQAIKSFSLEKLFYDKLKTLKVEGE